MRLPKEIDLDEEDEAPPIQSYIDLSLIIKQDERLRKYVTFDGIKEDSHLRHSELELNRRLNLMKRNESFTSHVTRVPMSFKVDPGSDND